MKNHLALLALLTCIAILPAPTFATQTSPLPMNTPRPLLFNDIVAFDTQVHRALRLPAQRKGFRFAAGAHLLPVTMAEAGIALRHYPLVFMPEGEYLTLVALTGLPGEGNRFVDAKGEWRPGAYIPAYVRGYPFIALRPSESAEPILALDPTAADFKAADGLPLLDETGQPGEQLKGILAYQNEFRLLADRTMAIGRVLKDANVLEEGSLQLQAPGSSEVQKIGGFLVVNEQKLRALPADALKKLMEADALGLAYIQLLSMGSLSNLFNDAGGAVPSTPTGKPRTRRSKKSGE
jgi:hypothetical protein